MDRLELCFLEKVNTICNLKAKYLIQNASNITYPFPFALLLVYIRNQDMILLNQKEIYCHISISHFKVFHKKVSILSICDLLGEPRACF